METAQKGTRSLAPQANWLSNPLSDWSDRQLLERFVTRRDERAFAALVWRHGPLVQGVCERLLRDHHAAEDAVQAVFLVLARRAGAISRPSLLANWLYGVAYRVSLKARADLRRWRRHVPLQADPLATDVAHRVDLSDLQGVIDDAIRRLPPQQRAAFVLCCMEGNTQTAAALKLECPVGSVATWVNRAKMRLRKLLAQRGLGLPAEALTASALCASGVSLALVQPLVHAAAGYAAGHSASLHVSAAAILWADQWTGTLCTVKIKEWAILTITILGAAGGIVWLLMNLFNSGCP